MQLQIQQWLNKLYYYIRILSIDIVLGAMSVSLFASQLFESQIPPVYWILLPLAVWAIYTFDHIIDGVNAQRPLQKPAYKFHFKFKSRLSLVLIIISVIILILFISFFHKSLFIIAIVGGTWVGMYFFAHKALPVKISKWIPKELFISIGYLMGTFGLPYLTKTKMMTRFEILVTLSFFLLVLTNVLIYSYFEFEEDRQNGFTGLIQIMGQSFGYRFIFYFVSICSVLNIYLVVNHVCNIVLLAISLSMYYILLKPLLFAKNQCYGKIADALFLLPGIIVLF